jgi:phosphatidylserine decarboxylase
MWKTIGKFYGIQFEEIQMQSLKDFHSFNEFFTRKLKPGLRPIENAHDPRVITSPCDGKVLNFGEITESKDGPCKYQLECIKGHTYPLDEFLFGVTSSNRDSNLTTNIVESAKQRGNKIVQCVIYLAPGDYHRYHSPADFTASFRRHIAGYLEPVKPSYVMKHKHVFKDNERATLFGDWHYGFFGMSFIGATNVGSIIINWDPELLTNQSKPKKPYFNDKNYATLADSKQIFERIP